MRVLCVCVCWRAAAARNPLGIKNHLAAAFAKLARAALFIITAPKISIDRCVARGRHGGGLARDARRPLPGRPPPKLCTRARGGKCCVERLVSLSLTRSLSLLRVSLLSLAIACDSARPACVPAASQHSLLHQKGEVRGKRCGKTKVVVGWGGSMGVGKKGRAWGGGGGGGCIACVAHT